MSLPVAFTVPLAHWHWQRMYALPSNVEFHRQVSSYFIKDDHKYLNVRGGFLSVTVDPLTGKKPSIAFRFHDPKATEVLFERVFGVE